MSADPGPEPSAPEPSTTDPSGWTGDTLPAVLRRDRVRGDVDTALRRIDHGDLETADDVLWPVEELPDRPMVAARTAALLVEIPDAMARRVQDAATACPCGRPDLHVTADLDMIVPEGAFPAGMDPAAGRHVVALSRSVLRARSQDGPAGQKLAIDTVMRQGIPVARAVACVLVGGLSTLRVRNDCPANRRRA